MYFCGVIIYCHAEKSPCGCQLSLLPIMEERGRNNGRLANRVALSLQVALKPRDTDISAGPREEVIG